MMKPDELSPPCRDFYEHALFKLSLSLVLAAFAMMFLGLSALSGGLSSSNITLTKSGVAALANDDLSDAALEAQGAGWGFACFGFLVGFFVMLIAAFWVSPFVGSPNERKTLSSPQEFESLGRSIAPPAVSYSTPAQPGQGQNPIFQSAPPSSVVGAPPTATYSVQGTVVGTPVYSSTGYLNRDAASAPPLN